jgi:hypothetical protein
MDGKQGFGGDDEYSVHPQAPVYSTHGTVRLLAQAMDHGIGDCLPRLPFSAYMRMFRTSDTGKAEHRAKKAITEMTSILLTGVSL